MRDQRIQESYMQALRPELPDKVPFITKFDDTENEKSKQKMVNRKDWKLQRQQLEQEMLEKKKQEQAWLEGLRPSLRDGEKDWNNDKEIQRPPSPEKLFHSDDEY
jgi:hypothetical protein